LWLLNLSDIWFVVKKSEVVSYIMCTQGRRNRESGDGGEGLPPAHPHNFFYAYYMIKLHYLSGCLFRFEPPRKLSSAAAGTRISKNFVERNTRRPCVSAPDYSVKTGRKGRGEEGRGNNSISHNREWSPISYTCISKNVVGENTGRGQVSSRLRKGREGKGREGKGREGKGREGKGREGKGREGEGKGREGKGGQFII